MLHFCSGHHWFSSGRHWSCSQHHVVSPTPHRRLPIMPNRADFDQSTNFAETVATMQHWTEIPTQTEAAKKTVLLSSDFFTMPKPIAMLARNCPNACTPRVAQMNTANRCARLSATPSPPPMPAPAAHGAVHPCSARLRHRPTNCAAPVGRSPNRRASSRANCN